MKYDLEDLSNRFSIEILAVEHGIDLEPSGQDYVALCPFHDDFETKSFRLYPITNTFWCYGCQIGGSVFDFVMHVENVSFAEAVEILAERAGLKTTFRLETANLQSIDFFREFRDFRETIEGRITEELRKLYFDAKKGLAFKTNSLSLSQIEEIWKWYDKSQRSFDAYLIKFKRLPKEMQESGKNAVFKYLISQLEAFYKKYIEKVEEIKKL